MAGISEPAWKAQVPLTGILAAVDNSPFAYAVMARAVQLTYFVRSDLTIMSVVRPGLASRNTMNGEENQLASFHRELVYKCYPPKGIGVVSAAYGGVGAVYRSISTGTRIFSVIEHGDPVERICAVADKMKADLVIVGNRGLGEAGTFVLGSVSEKVVHKCSRPVMVVKEPSSDPSEWEKLAEIQRSREVLGSK